MNFPPERKAGPGHNLVKHENSHPSSSPSIPGYRKELVQKCLVGAYFKVIALHMPVEKPSSPRQYSVATRHRQFSFIPAGILLFTWSPASQGGGGGALSSSPALCLCLGRAEPPSVRRLLSLSAGSRSIGRCPSRARPFLFDRRVISAMRRAPPNRRALFNFRKERLLAPLHCRWPSPSLSLSISLVSASI